jgi:hypothetical protein
LWRVLKSDLITRDVPEDAGVGVWTSVDDGATWQSRRLALPLRNGLQASALNEVGAMAARKGEVVLVNVRGVMDRSARRPNREQLCTSGIR